MDTNELFYSSLLSLNACINDTPSDKKDNKNDNAKIKLQQNNKDNNDTFTFIDLFS
jgi:hypothetical protein